MISKKLFAWIGVAAMLIAAPAFAQDAPKSGDAVWPYLAKFQGQQRLDAMYKEAKREGHLSIYGAVGIDRAQAFIDLFKAKYPGIDVTVTRMTTGEVATRLQTEARAGRGEADFMVSSSDWLDLIKNTLAPYEMTSWADLDPKFKHGSLKDGWTALDSDSLVEVIAWRTDRVKSDEAPKTLDQLADPKWKGRVGMNVVREQFIDAMIEIYGEKVAMQKIDALAALNNRTYNSIAATAQGLASGDVDIVWGTSGARAYGLKKSGAPIDFVVQDPPMSLNETMAVVKLAQHPYAAALLLDFMSQASTMEAWDKIEPGRAFGNLKGHYGLSLSSMPNLFIYRTIPQDRYKQLNRLVESKFLRNR